MQTTASISTIFSFKDVSPKTQDHLTKVYTLLLTSAVVCALGMYVNATFIIDGFLKQMMAMIASMYLAYQTQNRRNSEDHRKGYLAGLAFMMGFIVGPALHYLMEVEPRIVMQAVSYTAGAFISFSAISLFSKRRSYLFLGGIITTLI